MVIRLIVLALPALLTAACQGIVSEASCRSDIGLCRVIPPPVVGNPTVFFAPRPGDLDLRSIEGYAFSRPTGSRPFDLQRDGWGVRSERLIIKNEPKTYPCWLGCWWRAE